jgi:hypothetical protein
MLDTTKVNIALTKLVKEHEDTHRVAIASAVKVGSFLLDLKKATPEGEWTTYIEDNCTLTRTTRNNYMALARYFLATGEYPLNSSLSSAIRILSAPEEIKLKAKEMEANGETVTEGKVRELMGYKPSYKCLKRKIISVKKVVLEAGTNDNLKVQDLLNLRDEVSETLEGLDIIISNKRKGK